MQTFILSFLLSVFFLPFGVHGLDESGTKYPIWNQDPNKALNVSEIASGNSMREGMYDMIHNPTGDTSSVGGVISKVEIDSHTVALEEIMKLIQIIINYALGILAFLALVYLIYHGFLMFSAAGDDKKFEKGKSGIKVAAIALIGIGLSWMIVSAILWIIGVLTS